jgi:WD40 repeat protein
LDGTIRLWRTDWYDLEENGVLTGHTRGVSDVTFSQDGKTLASCNDDGTVKLWNVETKGLLLSLPVGRFPTSVEFSPDGGTLVVMNGPFFSEVDEILSFKAPSHREIDAVARGSE